MQKIIYALLTISAIIGIAVLPTVAAEPYAITLMRWNSENSTPVGSVLMNDNTNEWCISNCAKLPLVDPSLFATQATQTAKMQRTADFLNTTFQTAYLQQTLSGKPVNSALVASEYCNGMAAILYKGTLLFPC